MTSPLLSIVLPTFNVASKLEATLRSVLDDQAPFENQEVLVMDGASTDDTVAVAREWAARDSRVKVWSESDAGIFDGMNKGIARASGQLLFFLGAGDVMRPGILPELATLPNLHGHLLLYGKIWHQGMPPESTTDHIKEVRLTRLDLAWRNIPHQSAFYGREVFERVGPYNPLYRTCADYELNWRCWTDPAIETRFWNRTIAEFELGGLSSTAIDSAFQRDWPRLLWKRGGPLAWASFQIGARLKGERWAALRQLRRFVRRRWSV